MIHVRAMAAYTDKDQNGDVIMSEASTLQFSLVGLPTVQKFKELLDRSLNCSPEFGKEWFDLADKVEEFIAKEAASSTPLKN